VTVVPFEVKSIGSWAMSSKVIERLSLGRGGMQVLTTALPPLPHR
jgi:hypothetical protein